MDTMVEAIVAEIKLRAVEIDEPVETIYFGGGTPSILTIAQLSFLVNTIYNVFKVIEKVEVTLEANPEHLGMEYCKGLIEIGFNRISLGVQTFDDKILESLNRSHNSKQVFVGVDNLRAAGFMNLNMDLIYGIPYQSQTTWGKNLHTMLSLDPNHISAYALTIEEKTAFGIWQSRGQLKAVSDENYADQFEMMTQVLGKAGYEHYEVSNFALPNHQSKHNTSYWQGKPYLGLGPGAHSFNGSVRKFNVENNARFIKLLRNEQTAFEQETLSKEEQINEYLLTGLRTKNGISTTVLRERFNYEITAQNISYLNSIQKRNLGSFDGENLILNSSGFLVSDSIVLELMP